MRKKVVTGICILLAIVLLIPIPMRLKDGGTVVYHAILYQVENVHRIDPEATSENDYLEGMIVKILGGHGALNLLFIYLPQRKRRCRFDFLLYHVFFRIASGGRWEF